MLKLQVKLIHIIHLISILYINSGELGSLEDGIDPCRKQVEVNLQRQQLVKM